jgi:quinol monooxygenase YgiN
MYGLISSFTAKPGERDALVALMRGSADAMPGCRSYVVAIDPADADTIWVTEVWDDAAAHKASLAIPAVKAAIARAMPLIAGFGKQTVTTPVAVFGAAGEQG